MKNISKAIIFASLIVIILFAWQTKKLSVPSLLSQTNVLQTLYTLAGTKYISITPLKGGLSESTLYKADSKNKSYVIRLIGHRSKKDKLREIEAQTIASQKGWGPLLYASDIAQGWIIMDYVRPTPLTETDRMSDKMYRALGERLQQIHNGPHFLPSKSKLKEIEEILDQLKKGEKIPQSIDLTKIENIMESIKKNRWPILAPTHGDLNPNNIIFSHNQPFIIDFENATQDDPFYDLGTIGIYYIFNPYHEKTFLEAYFNRAPTQQEYTHYQSMKQVALLFYGLNFLKHIPYEIIKKTSVTAEPFEKVLQDVYNGTLNIAHPVEQLKIAVSILQEAINQYDAHTL